MEEGRTFFFVPRHFSKPKSFPTSKGTRPLWHPDIRKKKAEEVGKAFTRAFSLVALLQEDGTGL